MAVRSLAVGALLAGLLSARAGAATVQMDWVLPQNPDFSSTFHQGDQVTLQWTQNLQDWFSAYCGPCDKSNVDLWVVGGNNDKFQYKIAASLDITTALSWDWTVLIPDETLVKMQVWAVRFIPSGTVPHGSGDGAEISSPQFQIEAAVTTTSSISSSTTTPSGTAGSPDTAAITGASATTAPANSGSGGLSTGAQAGIGAGIGLAAVAVIAIVAFWVIRRRRNARTGFAPPPAAEMRHAIPQDQQSSNANQNSPIGGYYQPDTKNPTQPGNLGPPYIPPLSEAAFTPSQQKPASHELNANVDPAELEGSRGMR